MSGGLPQRYVPSSFELRNVDMIGNYAIQPNWADGHTYGSGPTIGCGRFAHAAAPSRNPRYPRTAVRTERFEWSDQKARLNFAKHRVRFEDAMTVFRDPLHFTIDDLDHSDDENRFLTIGADLSGNIYVVSYSYRGERIRIISARRATAAEIARYEQEIPRHS